MPPNRRTDVAMIIMDVSVVDGFMVEILLNHLLSEKDSDVACFLTLSDIWCFLGFNQVLGYFFCAGTC